MTDYKPGQLAKATVRGVPDVTVMRTCSSWTTATAVGPTGGFYSHSGRHVTDIRPLVVLDWHPSPTHLNDLLGLLREHYWTSLADQIEKQTRPAIEEPKGLGAVVEDSEQDRLTRYCDANDDGEWIGEDGRSWRWGDIDVVRVVWAGVTS